MACEVQAYLNDVKGRVLSALPETEDIAKTSLKLIKAKTGKDTVAKVEMFLLHKHLGEGKAFNSIIGPKGSKFDVVIKEVKINEDGNLDIKVSKKGEDKLYTYNNVDLTTGVSKNGSKVDLVEGLGVKVFGGRDYSVSGFDVTGQANAHVARLLAGMGEKGNEAITPYLKKWHNTLKVKSSIYAESTRLVQNTFGDSEVWNKIKAFTFTTGDINREKFSKLLSIVNTVARRNFEILDTALPKLDRQVNKAVTNKDKRKSINKVFGGIALGNLLDQPGVWNAVETGSKSIDELLSDLKLSAHESTKAKNLSEFMLTGKVTKNTVNAGRNKKIGVAATLMALASDGDKLLTTLKEVHKKHPKLYVELRQLAIVNKDLNSTVNSGTASTGLGNDSNVVYTGYEEAGTMDVYEQQLEFKVLDKEAIDMLLEEQFSEVWKVIRPATKSTPGVVARSAIGSSMAGLGTGINRIKNGIVLDRKYVEAGLVNDKEWLSINNVVVDEDSGYPTYRMLLTAEEKDKAGLRNDIAHTLYRTYVHNKELVETRAARQLIVDSMVEDLAVEADWKELERKLRSNRKKKAEDRVEIPVFLRVDGMNEIPKEYKEIAYKYKKVYGISDYGNFNKNVQYVRKDMADMVVGYKQSAMINDNWPTFQEWERYYKQLVQMLKIKLVVASPAKLAVDIASNFGILMTTGMSPIDAYKYHIEAIELSNEMSKLESELVKVGLDIALVKADGKDTVELEKSKAEIEEKIKNHKYADAIKFGFIQSEGTELMIKEFDTISGLQHSIDTLLSKILEKDKDKVISAHKAVVWWMEAGFGIDDIVNAVGTSSKLKGTGFGEELVAIGDRLANKKPRVKYKEAQLGRKLTTEEIKDLEDNADTVRYVSELLAAPSSEVVRQGSRFMQLGDIGAKWALYRHTVEEMSKEYMKNNKTSGVPKADLEKIKLKAGMYASDMFIDYRINMPKEIKMLSDIGVLMFPSFWIRAQKIIWNLGKNYPVNMGVGYIATDLLGINGASIIDANIVNKASEGTLISAGQDVLNLGTLVIGAR